MLLCPYAKLKSWEGRNRIRKGRRVSKIIPRMVYLIVHYSCSCAVESKLPNNFSECANITDHNKRQALCCSNYYIIASSEGRNYAIFGVVSYAKETGPCKARGPMDPSVYL